MDLEEGNSDVTTNDGLTSVGTRPDVQRLSLGRPISIQGSLEVRTDVKIQGSSYPSLFTFKLFMEGQDGRFRL